MTARLIPARDLRADPANPRLVDLERLDLIRLAIDRLGWLLPAVATPDGMLLSGHQRVRAVRELGHELVPVLCVEPPTEARRQALNIALNRGTNDFRATDVNHAIDGAALRRLFEGLPSAADLWPCLRPVDVAVGDLLSANAAPFEDHHAAVAATIARGGVDYPLVVGPDLRIVNGAGRLRRLAGKGATAAQCVVIGDARAAQAARIALNSLSMQYRLEGAAADLLRHGAHRRSRSRRKHLGSGWIFPVWRGRAVDFDLSAHRDGWLAAYGRRVLDFGAGHGDEADILLCHGIDVTAFEPYPVTARHEVDVERGRASARALLSRVTTGARFDAVVMSSVLNSVPLSEDRRHLITLAAALCGSQGRFLAAARGVWDPGWRGIVSGGHLSAASRRRIQFVGDEPGTLIGDLRQAPKVQKFFDPKELRDLLEERFGEVSIGRHINNVTAIATRPRKVDRGALRDAILFEFDLPMPDGSRLGLVGEALEAFSGRLGCTL